MKLKYQVVPSMGIVFKTLKCCSRPGRASKSSIVICCCCCGYCSSSGSFNIRTLNRRDLCWWRKIGMRRWCLWDRMLCMSVLNGELTKGNRSSRGWGTLRKTEVLRLYHHDLSMISQWLAITERNLWDSDWLREIFVDLEMGYWEWCVRVFFENLRERLWEKSFL